MEQFLHLVDQYGYIILFLSLMLELIALPIPTEPLMSYAGYLAYKHVLNFPLSIAVASLGSFIGLSVAYWIGFRLGYPFFQRYGARLHLGPDRLDKMSRIFQQYGPKFLLISCFIPGVRHIAGYFAGIARVNYRSYAIFAAFGVVIWTSTFIGLGHALGPQYQLIETSVKKYLLVIVSLVILLVIAVYLFRRNLAKIQRWIIIAFKKLYDSYRIRPRLKLLVTGAVIVFIVFVTLAIGFIQAFFGHDFGDFNQIALIIFWDIFRKDWEGPMALFQFLSSVWALIGIILLTFVWIYFKGENRKLEFRFLILLIVGGILYVRLMQYLFNQASAWLHVPIEHFFASSNEQVITSTMFYGFFAFLLSRYSHRYTIKILIPFVLLFILFVIGLGAIYDHVQSPSGIIAGYVFGGVWLSFTIVLLESFRLIRLTFRIDK
ncbi:VTT domain-containing protein [Camelliibacillus cellulosilyticus]|uniref:VTT domain-containing protein n=1 Tax=Camelliibacillus cellulosilyticus TaxID=2174486 RepID=A0ABV9GL37_9BACL